MAKKALSYIFLIGSLIYLIAAYGLSFGMLSSPKAGFLPSIIGGAAVLTAILVIVREQTTDHDGAEENWRKFTLIISGLFFYLICLSVVGYIIATFVIMLYLLKIMELQGWSWPIIISAAMATAFYGLFNCLLSISLP